MSEGAPVAFGDPFVGALTMALAEFPLCFLRQLNCALSARGWRGHGVGWVHVQRHIVGVGHGCRFEWAAHLTGFRRAFVALRVSAANDREAVADLATQGHRLSQLRGQVPAEIGSPEFAGLIVAHGLEVTEEHGLDLLLADMDDGTT